MTEIKIIPTGGALGAEVRGVELHGNITPDKVEALKQAWYDHLVLLFRKQQLNDNDLLRASSIFGHLQVGGAIRYFRERGLKEGKGLLSQHNEITVVSNLDDRGNPVRVNAGLGSNEVIWHSDNSYVETPPAGSMLYAIQIPENGGGDTSFANQYLAYETLPDIMRIAIEGKQQRHDASRNSAGVLRPTANLPKTPEEVEGPVHPLVRVHPETGRKALYLGRRRNWPSNYILDIPIKRSEALLDRLWRHATKPEFVWTHQWRPGDVLLWDNRCVMHYRTEVDHTRPRVLHRTQIQGETVIPG